VFTQSPIPSVSHPGYVHPPGTEATLLSNGQGGVLVELMVPEREGEPAWTEQFLLPRGMKVDPSRPVVIEPRVEGAHLVVDKERRIVGVGVMAKVEGGMKFQMYKFAAGFVDETGAPVG
jgi:hypothetical protein